MHVHRSHPPDEERQIREAALDETIEASFPASDPPSTDPNPEDEGALRRRQQQGGSRSGVAAPLSTPMAAKRRRDHDVHKGVVEGDRPDDEQHWNANAPALSGDGLPRNLRAIAEDRIGANSDYPDVANADERGRTSDAPRLELTALL